MRNPNLSEMAVARLLLFIVVTAVVAVILHSLVDIVHSTKDYGTGAVAEMQSEPFQLVTTVCRSRI